MKILPNLRFTCHWNKRMVCKNDHHCKECSFQPADDVKSNGKNEPMKIAWDKSEYGIWPKCPSCGEMPYSTERCFFCGQRFIQDDPELQEYIKPTPLLKLDCLRCGGKGTLVGRRAKCNGHFHGKCEICGCWVHQ